VSSGEAAAPSGAGFLSINSAPWSSVEIDGRSIGNTPILRHELRAGDHRVTLIVQAWNLRQSRRITIRAGEVTNITVRFQEPGVQGAAPPPQGPGAGPRPMGPPPQQQRPMGPPPHGPMGPGPMPPQGPMGPGPMGR
jgi:hypothetical protein